MDLILWRHADAEDGYPDLGRELTEKGHKQADQAAKWLRPRLPKQITILVSPATRAQQTAQALTSQYLTVKEIAPGASYSSVLEAARWPNHQGVVLVVGHQPTLGQVAAVLLTDEAYGWHIKKGAVWWLSHRAGEQTSLRAVIPPDLV
jgi:phosphohistidine phosphatase